MAEPFTGVQRDITRATAKDIQHAIFIAGSIVQRHGTAQPIPLSTADTVDVCRAVLTLAFDRRLLGNDDPHDMIGEFVPLPPIDVHDDYRVESLLTILDGEHLMGETPTQTLKRIIQQLRDCQNMLQSRHENGAPWLPHDVVNTRQVGGAHYGLGAIQHWDIVHLFKLDYFQGQITKYVFRWRAKNGVEDLEKAAHYLEKYITLNKKESVK